MPNYKRAKSGATYFFTVVTHERRRILCLEQSRAVLRWVIRNVQLEYPFTIEAFVLLPDHLHCIWTFPKGDTDYSKRWGMIKKEFTKQVRNDIERLLGEDHLTESRIKHREAGIWQRRFWEHLIRDQNDFNRHCDYIHYNPVKHGLVSQPSEWAYSSFHRFVKAGKYAPEWCAPVDVESQADFGE